MSLEYKGRLDVLFPLQSSSAASTTFTSTASEHRLANASQALPHSPSRIPLKMQVTARVLFALAGVVAAAPKPGVNNCGEPYGR